MKCLLGIFLLCLIVGFLSNLLFSQGKAQSYEKSAPDTDPPTERPKIKTQ